jgi:hypothetical protein
MGHERPGMTVNTALAGHVQATLDRIREPMGLDRWQIEIATGPCKGDDGEDCTGAAHADPEYRKARIVLDIERMETGDDVEEHVVHETTHLPVWPIHKAAEDLAHAWADSAPPALREAIRAYAAEQVRQAAETTTTDLGHAFLRLFRRLWAAEAEIKQLRAELRAVNRQGTVKA